jgi:hypothetical protein
VCVFASTTPKARTLLLLSHHQLCHHHFCLTSKIGSSKLQSYHVTWKTLCLLCFHTHLPLLSDRGARRIIMLLWGKRLRGVASPARQEMEAKNHNFAKSKQS